MKRELFLFSIVLLIVFSGSFFIFKYGNITGNVIEEANSSSKILNFSNSNRADALIALKEAENIMFEMIANGFSIEYVNDTLQIARNSLKQADYAEILRNSSISETNPIKIEARRELKLVDWRKINYNLVIENTQKIKDRRNLAFEIYDSINALESKVNNYDSEFNLDSVKEKIIETKEDFYLDRYDSASEKIVRAREDFESITSESASLTSLREGAKNFFQRYWFGILIFFIILYIFGNYFFHKIRIKNLEKAISRTKAEQITLNQLMKRTQEERFKENNISGLVYNIRMKKYQEKLNELKEILPVLQNRLSNLKDKKD